MPAPATTMARSSSGRPRSFGVPCQRPLGNFYRPPMPASTANTTRPKEPMNEDCLYLSSGAALGAGAVWISPSWAHSTKPEADEAGRHRQPERRRKHHARRLGQRRDPNEPARCRGGSGLWSPMRPCAAGSNNETVRAGGDPERLGTRGLKARGTLAFESSHSELWSGYESSQAQTHCVRARF